MKKLKTKIAISSLALTLSLSGCSFNLIDNQQDETIVDLNESDIEDSIDKIMSFKEDENSNNYSYLLERTSTTKATFAHISGESTITSKGKLFDDKKEMSTKTFTEDTIQPIILPNSFILFHIYDLNDLIGTYGECDITCKKIKTFDEDTLYYFDSTITFNDFAETIGLDIKEGDTIEAKSLYKLNSNGDLELLYRTQSGVKESAPNVLESNYNDEQEILLPLNETIFKDMSGEYSIDYLRETLDVYRFDTPDDNDLKDAVDNYNLWRNSNPSIIQEVIEKRSSGRFKALNIQDFDPDNSWIIENWWSEEEKVSIGLKKEIKRQTIDDFINLISETEDLMQGIKGELECLK